MKAISSTVTKIDGDNITITGKLVDITFPDMVAQRHNTIMHPVHGHPSKPRHLRNTSHGFLVLRPGSQGFLFPNEELVAIGLEVDPKLTDVPAFTVHPTKDKLAGTVVSEIPATGKIQQSDDGKVWVDVQNADANFKGEAGKFYRCVATNKNGDAISNPVHFPKPVEPKPAVK